jgi:hypothetical protein
MSRAPSTGFPWGLLVQVVTIIVAIIEEVVEQTRKK